MARHLPLLASCLLATVYGCSNRNASTFEEQTRAYNECIGEHTSTLGQPAGSASASAGPFASRLDTTDVASVARRVRDDLKASARQSLESARISAIAARRCEALRPTAPPYGNADGGMASSSNGAAPEADSPTSAAQASGTNNQVAGVDEADFVKNDTKYIYVVEGSHFRILDAFPGSSMRQIADVTVPGTAKKLFVEGNRALVYSSVPVGNGGYPDYATGYYGSGECTYGQSGCVPSGDGTETEITIFDIGTLTAPRVVRSIHSSSSLVAARRIGTAVHTVLAQPSPFRFGSVTDYPSIGTSASEVDIAAAYAAARSSTEKKIDALPVESSVLPTWSDSTRRAIGTGLWTSGFPDGSSLTSVLSVDIRSDAELSIASIIGRPGWVYASENALYMAVPHEQRPGWGWFEGQSADVKELSTIHKFAIGASAAATRYSGSGVVKGRVVNQLAMDQQNGFLRVATTTGHLPDPRAHNTISILDGALAETGKIDDIAVGEDIRSARFDGDRGYIVTFKKTDPLFVFDLHDPRAPRTLGELKIPGFSTYIHMMDANHLLTIGYDAADQGDFAYFTGVLLQIFDVTNPAAPTLKHKEVIGTRGTSSEALTNHLAFTYFAPKNLLALPMTVCEGGNGNGQYGYQMTFSGLMVYDVTANDGFKLRGKVGHPSTTSDNQWGYMSSACGNWWTNASSEVKRSIVMDDWVYSVSSSRIKANALSNLAVDAAEVSIRN